MTSILERPTSTLTVKDRAGILRHLAHRWDSLITEFDEINPRITEDVLVNLAQPYTHPSLDREEITDLMRTLAEQLTALDDYLSIGLIPATLDEDEAYGNAPAEVLVALMEQDIDLSLWWLLRGDTQPCSRCKRTVAYVYDWDAADWPRSIWCSTCNEATAR